MADEDKPPIMFPVNLPFVRRVEEWLWNRPKTTIFLMFVSFGLISSPAWFSDVWSLFSNEAPVPKIMNFVLSLPISFSWYWIPVGLGAIMLTAIASLFWRERKRLLAEIARAKAEAESPKAATVEPESATLEVHDSIHGKCQYDLAHRIADTQAKAMRGFVTVSRVAVWEHKLNDPVPTIRWGFMVKNQSLFPINLVEVRNNLFFEKTELAERRFDYTNEVEQLQYWREGSVIFEQRLSGPEAQYIKNTPEGKFRFNRLIIKVGNPKSFPIVEPQELEIGDDLETTLNKITYKETEGMVSLRKERDRLKDELQKAQGADSKLTFEIDETQSQIDTTGGGTAGYRISAKIRLRCMKVADHPMAIREFHATLLKEDGPEKVIVPKESVLVVMGHPDMKIIDFANGWTIAEPLTDYRWFMFYLDITEQQLQQLSLAYFIRITMGAVGQKPYSVDFGIDNWHDARKSNSNITVRGKTA